MRLTVDAWKVATASAVMDIKKLGKVLHCKCLRSSRIIGCNCFSDGIDFFFMCLMCWCLTGISENRAFVVYVELMNQHRQSEQPTTVTYYIPLLLDAAGD